MIEKLLTLLNGTLTLLNRRVEALGSKTDKVSESVSDLAKEVRSQKPPVVNVEAPQVTVTVPDVIVPEIKVPDIVIPEIKIPEIVVPEPKVTVNVPEIKLPEIKVPTPQVKVDCQPPVVNVNTPETIEVTGFASFTKAILAVLGQKYSLFGEVSRHKPVPVIIVDQDGVYQKLTQTIMGAMGGGPSIVGLKNANNEPVNVATEETLKSIAGFNVPEFDTQEIDESGAPATTVITYKKGGVTVATKTITVSGTTTTITTL